MMAQRKDSTRRNSENSEVTRRERRKDAVMALGIALGLLISAVIALTGDLALGPRQLWLTSSATGVLVTAVITAIGVRYVDRLHRQGR